MLNQQSSQSKVLKKSLLRNLIQQIEAKANYQKQQQKIILFAKQVNPQILRESLKLSKVWRGAGVVNKQFGDINPLKNKALDAWQIQRIPLSKRSYSSPKDFKGLKNDFYSREFTIKNSNSLYSNEFNRYLQTIKQKYQNKLFRPNARELQQIADKKKQFNVSKLKFTKSTNLFGTPKQKEQIGTIKSFKSEILRKTNRFQ